MKNAEKLAIILIVLWLITLFPNPLTTLLLTRFYPPEAIGRMELAESAMVTFRVTIAALVQIGVGYWMFIQATRDHRSQWTWCLFGLTFGINAAILYFLVQLTEQVKLKSAAE
ncbi:MAG: hypothetical protein AAF329_18630 [Cyanobacteria bacterium P01_A01_bin.17]